MSGQLRFPAVLSGGWSMEDVLGKNNSWLSGDGQGKHITKSTWSLAIFSHLPVTGGSSKEIWT